MCVHVDTQGGMHDKISTTLSTLRPHAKQQSDKTMLPKTDKNNLKTETLVLKAKNLLRKN